MADFFILALTVFTFQNNTKIAIYIYLLDIFALFLVFSYQFTAKCLSLPPPLLGGAISKPLTLPFALAFRTSNIETVINHSLYITVVSIIPCIRTMILLVRKANAKGSVSGFEIAPPGKGGGSDKQLAVN